jgi:hypothetical protein
MLVLSMSPSLPLLPEPMVKMWPSNSLQAPTSVAFLGMVAVTLFPRAPRPRPPLPPFSPRPPRPAGAARAIFSNLRGLTDSPEMALVLVALAFSRQAVLRAELFDPTKFARSYVAPRALGSDSTPIRRLGEQFPVDPTPWGAIPRQSDALGSDSPSIRHLGEQFHARSQRFARALVSDGFARNAWMGLGGRPCLRARS